MKAIFVSSLIALSLGFAAHAAAPAPKAYKQIRCAQPGGRTTVVKLDLIDAATLTYSYDVSLAGDGKAFTSRQPVSFSSQENGFLIYEASPGTDSDTFGVNALTGEGWISLIEYQSMPFEFDVECRLK